MGELYAVRISGMEGLEPNGNMLTRALSPPEVLQSPRLLIDEESKNACALECL